MTPFLKQVALHYFELGDIQNRCFVFPNRRALVFFGKYLSDAVAQSGTPVQAPVCITVNDLFYRLAGMSPTDKVQLLLDLYDCYAPLRKNPEPLDEFIFWGDILLNDFSDVDKYLSDAKGVFSNVADFKNIRDTYSYLSEKQRNAIEAFLSHFNNGQELTVDLSSTDPDYKERFLQIWDILYPLYTSFNEYLKAHGRSYEGQVYRSVAERLSSESAADVAGSAINAPGGFVFVGLNALNECEKKLMSKLRDAHLAEFCWDYSSTMIKAPANKSSLFMDDNVQRFPQAFRIDGDGLPETVFHTLSVPSSVGQCKHLPQIFSEIGAVGMNTAVVLPDESMLIPVLNSVPETIQDINVTMGYPMGSSEFHSLISEIAAMQLHLREKDGVWHFYHRQVWDIFSNSIFRSLLKEEQAAKVRDIKSKARFYIPQSELCGDSLFDLIFQPVACAPSAASERQTSDLVRYMQSLCSGLALMLKEVPGMGMELEFMKATFMALRHLERVSLNVLPSTFFRLLSQLLCSQAVPFSGEPLKGLQIMGPLEVRALDFDNIIILSCNEGMFPRRSVSSSFIPAELRKSFELPTYEYQDAVWAYYFYRMIQRAGNVWLVYDSRTEGVRSGEESRYIKQLELDFGVILDRRVSGASIARPSSMDEIPKTGSDIEEIRKSWLSASALQNYLSCPAKFYYHTVKKLKAEDEVAESLDTAMIGRVFHSVMENLYSGRREVDRAYVKSLIGDPSRIRNLVRHFIMEELRSFEVSGRNLIFLDIVQSYVLKALSRDVQLMDSYKVDSFTVHGLELKRTLEIDGFHFLGFIDRLDSFSPDEVRIVDYKTGKVTDDDININEGNAQAVVEALFGPSNQNRPKIALQLYLYDMFVKNDPAFAGKTLVNSIYQTNNLFVQEVKKVHLCDTFCDLMGERLRALLQEMVNPLEAFRRTDDQKTCSYCDFKMICGR